MGRRSHSPGRTVGGGQVEVGCSVFFTARILLQYGHRKFLTRIVTCPGLHSGKGTNPSGRNRKSLIAASKILQRGMTEIPQPVHTKQTSCHFITTSVLNLFALGMVNTPHSTGKNSSSDSGPGKSYRTLPLPYWHGPDPQRGEPRASSL